METSTGYLSRSWTDLTSDKKWWQPVLILALVSWIPIIGQMITAGYLLDWSREAAWGMKRGLPHQAGDIGKRLKWGFFQFVIQLVWIVPLTFAITILAFIPFLGILVALIGCFLLLGAAALLQVGCVNMAIYDQIGAGFQFSRILNMAKIDTSGLVRSFCISFLALIPSSIYLVLCGSSSLIDITTMYANMGINYSLPDTLIYGLLGTGTGMAGIKAVLYIATLFCGTAISALSYRAYGHWVSQFKPAQWGGLNQPMPFEPGYTPRPQATPSASASAQQSTSYEDVKEQVASAAATASSFVKETAEKAADAASTAAAGFKPEQSDTAAEEEAEVIEAEVVAVDDAEPQEQPAEEVAEEESASSDDEEATAPSEEAPKVAYCANCGTPVEGDHKYCVNCGYKL